MKYVTRWNSSNQLGNKQNLREYPSYTSAIGVLLSSVIVWIIYQINLDPMNPFRIPLFFVILISRLVYSNE